MASDLEEAAHAALLSVRALRERVGEAKEGCEESSSRVAKFSEALEADRNALHEAVEELDKTVEEATKQLSDDMVAAESALTDIVTGSHEAGTQGQQVLDAEASALEDLAQHVEGIDPQIAALAETAEAASRAALERAGAIADSLSQLVDDTEQLLSVEFASALTEMTHDLETTAIAIRSLLEDQCPAILQEKEKEFEAKTAEVRELVDKLFPDMQQHADEVADYAMKKLEELADEEMDDIEKQAQELKSDLEHLMSVATQRTADIDHAGETVAERMRTNGDSAKAVEQALENVRARWVLFGFTI